MITGTTIAERMATMITETTMIGKRVTTMITEQQLLKTTYHDINGATMLTETTMLKE